MTEAKLCAIIPAAGRSERMGQCKMLLKLQGQPIIVRCIETLLNAGIDDITVVLAPPYGASIHEEIAHLPVEVVWNCEEESDMAGSLKVGLLHLPKDVSGIMVFLPDTPLVMASTCRMLAERHSAAPLSIHIPTHAARRGHPVVIPAAVFNELPRYPTLRDLLQLHQELINLCPTDDAGILHDIDTPDDYLEAVALLR